MPFSLRFKINWSFWSKSDAIAHEAPRSGPELEVPSTTTEEQEVDTEVDSPDGLSSFPDTLSGGSE